METVKIYAVKLNKQKTEENTMEKETKTLSWLEMTEEELEKVTDISVCMYGRQGNSGGEN